MEYKIAEKFVSINGEGPKAGELAIFIRFINCNLDCSYCDTKWANSSDASYKIETEESLVNYIRKENIKNITITGGEPLLQKHIQFLIENILKIKDTKIEIETNGSISIEELVNYRNETNANISFTIDYKSPSSNMEKYMHLDNYNLIDQRDSIKFVVGSMKDLICGKDVIDKFNLINKCNIFFSPIFSLIEPQDIVKFLIEENLNNVRLQLQLHKYIWDPNKKGV
ncbi:MAG: putative 7-carboxy-7-deazaguanine synthase QueE [Fusobacterium sp. JB021]|nr:putative 7-carboxy-7-deazaguanine synthase QueE [Fusobacterium sp. JB020]MDP0493521.1 putative 7-carboxy-7-deazaguanine synthase QueE [Fusobacterium sp. JB021]MDP0505852.1 putative 7-carboxy-7-deazaguanine synthase QueE [Fusobacterium sp. JB019]